LNLDDLDPGKEGEGGGDMQQMLEKMMAQLMSKDILYDPLKELASKVRRCHPQPGSLTSGSFGFPAIVPRLLER
jgi:hypothetical protein